MNRFTKRRKLLKIATWSIKGPLSVVAVLAVMGFSKINDMLSGEMIPPGLIMLKQDIQLQRLALVCDRVANKSRAFTFHVVLTKNLQMAQDLSHMTSTEYFKADKAKAFDQNYHNMYKIFRFHIIPGQKLPEQKLKIDSGSKYVGGYFFATLPQSHGNNRIRIPSSPQVMVKFTKSGMTLVTPDLMSEGIEELENKIGLVPGV